MILILNIDKYGNIVKSFTKKKKRQLNVLRRLMNHGKVITDI